MTSMNIPLRLIAKGRKDEVLRADKIDRRWGRDKEQRVEIRGIRLFGRKGGPLHVQVFTGARWITVINVPWAIEGAEMSITARAIKHRLHRTSERRNDA